MSDVRVGRLVDCPGQLRDARARASQADKDIDAIMRAEFPVGKIVFWERGGHIQSGTVERSIDGYGERLYVQNNKTCRFVWITAFDLVRPA